MQIKEQEKYLNSLKERYPIEDFLSFNEFDISEKLAMHAKKYAEFDDLYLREKNKLLYLKATKDKLVCIVFDKLKFHDQRNLTTREIENYYINNDDSIIKINNIIIKQQLTVDYFELCVKALDKMSWNMKNFLEERKMIQ